MSKSRKILVGLKFGMLSVLHDAPVPKHVAQAIGNKGVRNRYVMCQCDCGRKTSVRVDHLRSGKTRSCGCLSAEFVFTQRLTASPGDDLGYRDWMAERAVNALKEISTDLETAAKATAAGAPMEYPGPRPSDTEARHGLAPGEYAEMMTEQEGVCAICKEPPGVKPLCVDHDHSTGVVRGLLCQRCNHGIGFLRDSITLMAAAMKYLTTGRAAGKCKAN